MCLIAINKDRVITSSKIAYSVNTNPVVIRNISGMLKSAGLVTSKPGVAGYNLTKELPETSLLEIYKAIQPQDQLFQIHAKPNPDCLVGRNIQTTLNVKFDKAQLAMEQELANTTLQDIVDRVSDNIEV